MMDRWTGCVDRIKIIHEDRRRDSPMDAQHREGVCRIERAGATFVTLLFIRI